MRDTFSKPIASSGVLALAIMGVVATSPSAKAQDFFSALFGGFTGPPQRSAPVFPDSGSPIERAPRASSGGGGVAYCVRTCDGRYFPLSSQRGQSSTETCNSFCPASETQVFYGSKIDHATSKSGKSYSQLPNAFRYRKELIAGCTCNGKDPGGLAHIGIEDDPTLRKGDLVAEANGSVVASRASDNRGASASERSVAPSRRSLIDDMSVSSE
jgi:hypothetical protein